MGDKLAELLVAAQAKAKAESGANPLLALLGRAKATVEADRKRVEDAERVDKQRKALASGHLTAEEQAQTRQAIQLWEAKHVWRTVGKTALFVRHSCTCGECVTVFSHWMLEQVHIEVPTRKRQTRASMAVLEETKGEIAGIKPRVGFHENSVEMCPVCAGSYEVNLSEVPAFQVVL